MYEYKYKFRGIIWPYFLQSIMAVFLIIAWVILIRSNTPFFGMIMGIVISLFIILLFYYSYPARFELSSEGLKVVFSMGQEAFFSWKDVKDFRVNGPVGVIVVRPRNGAGRIFNKYLAFLYLLEDGAGFKRMLLKKLA